MKRLLVAVLTLGIFVSVLDLSQAAPSPSLIVVHEPELVVVNRTPIELSAKAYCIIDIETGNILFSKNANEELPIASVTKLFTAAAIDVQSIEEAVVITTTDVETEGRAGKLKSGQSYTAQELLFPLLLESSNDAAVALARNIGQVTLGSKVLADTSGLSPQNKASACTVATEMRRIFLTQPHVFDVTKLKQYVGTYTGWVNNSPVYDLPGYQGGKHGYTEAAGKTLAAVFREDTLNSRSLGYVILGSTDVRVDTMALRTAVEQSVHVK